MNNSIDGVIGPNVLLIEDDNDYAKALSRLLKDECNVIIHVTSCEDAVKTLAGREDFFDAIILDHGLGQGKNGIECLRTLVQLNIVSEVIMLTGRGNRDLGITALREGAFMYFTKQSESDEELICALMRSQDISQGRRISRRWEKQGIQATDSIKSLLVVASLAIGCVVILNWVAPTNFLSSVFALVVMSLTLMFGVSKIKNLKLAWKEEGKELSLEAVGPTKEDKL